MTVGEWIETRSPEAPAALRARLREVVDAQRETDALNTSEVCLAAAEHVVIALLGRDSTSRDAALDLLAADALVTYAFEAAAAAPIDLIARASDAMTRMAALGAPAA